jgi:hypothetical protein
MVWRVPDSSDNQTAFARTANADADAESIYP